MCAQHILPNVRDVVVRHVQSTSLITNNHIQNGSSKKVSYIEIVIQEAVSEGLKLRWIETMDMISDSMTKNMSNKVLRQALDAGKLMVPVKFLRYAHKGISELEAKLSSSSTAEH